MKEISIIIPCYNAAGHLRGLLEALQRQTLSRNKFEIIIVNDGSTDKTDLLAKQFPVGYFFQKNKGAGPARNLGAQKARGQILLFTDSDCIVPEDWAERHFLAHQKNKDFGIIAGGVKKPKEGNLISWADFFSSWFNAHENLPKQIIKDYCPTLNFSVKKEAFIKTGGFWEKRLTGEDVDFCFRARKKGVRILFEPSLSLWHKGPRFGGFLKHNFNWGHHAPFVRGKQKNLPYHFLFSGGLLKSFLLFLPISFCYTLFLGLAWWRYQPLRFVLCLPLILLGKLYYGFGLLSGSYEKSLKTNDK